MLGLNNHKLKLQSGGVGFSNQGIRTLIEVLKNRESLHEMLSEM